MTMLNRPILALDPGLRALGVAVLTTRGQLRHAAVLTAPRRLTLGRRLGILRTQLADLLGTYRPRLVVIEATWRNRNASLALAHRTGLLCRRLARNRGIPVQHVPSTTVRRALLGHGWAGKRDTALLVASRFPELRLYLRQDRAWKERHFQNLFDAAALGLYVLEAGKGPKALIRTPRHRSR